MKVKILLLALLMVLAGCNKKNNKSVETDTKSNSSKTVRIGAILPLTGHAAFIGQWHLDGFNLAIDRIQKEDNITIKLYAVDSKNDPKTGLSAYRSVINKDLDAVISSFTSVSLPIIENEKLTKPTYLISVSYPNVASRDKLLFRYNINVEDEAVLLSNALKDIDGCNVLYINDEYGMAAFNTFKAHYKKQIVFHDSFQKNKSDFKNLIMSTNFNKPYFIAGYGRSYTQLLKQLSIYNPKAKIYTVYSMDIPQFIKPLQGSGLDVVYTKPKMVSKTTFENFTKEFFQYKGEKPNLVHALSYDLIYIILKNVTKQTQQIKSVYGYNIEISKEGEIKVPLSLTNKKL